MAPSNCTVYKSHNDNAPVLSGTRGSLIALLTAVLVDGYGTQPGAGWTKEFENGDGTVACFRNNPVEGTGFFLRVNELTSAAANTPMFSGYEIMTDEDNGSGPFSGGQVPAGNLPFYISNAENTSSRAWTIIANDTSFYLFCYYSVTGLGTPTKHGSISSLFFGDFIPVSINDTFNCCLVHGGTYTGSNNYNAWYANSASSTSSNSTSIAYNCLHFPRYSTGAPLYYSRSSHLSGGGPGNYGQMGNLSSTYVQGEPLFLARPVLPAENVYKARGWLPGLFYPMANLPFEPNVVLTDNGVDYIVAGGAFYSSYYFQLFINTSNFWS